MHEDQSIPKDIENTKGSMAAFAVSHPHLMIVICLVIVVLGTLGIVKMPKDLLPASNQPAVQILSIYSGMATQNVETNLTWKFERYTGQAVGLVHQESRSMPGVSIVKNFFDPASADLNSAMSQTTSLVMSVLRRLPPGAQPPIILPFDPMSSAPLALVAVTGDEPINKMYDFAQYSVRRVAQSNPGAMAPTVMGGAEEQIIIELDPKNVEKYNFSPLEVIDKLSHLNTFIPTGDVKMKDFDYQVVSNGLPSSVNDFNRFPVRSQDGVSIFLNQVGKAEEGNIIQTNVVTIDGKEQIYVPIFRQQGANSLSVMERVRQSIADLGKTVSNIKLRIVSDQTVYIRKAIESIAEEALIGGGLAALMVFLFLGNPRATLAVLISLPLTVFFVGMGLNAAGQTINVMTLGGMALSIGILVDNSIVAIENIIKHLNECQSPKRSDRCLAIVRAVQEVTAPIVAATLCNFIVLSPVILLGGVTQILFAAVAKTVMFAIIGSLIVQTAVVPIFATTFLANYTFSPGKFFIAIQKGMEAVTKAYGKFLGRVMQHFNIVLAVVVLLFIVGAALVGRIGTELFPRADAGGFVLEVRFPSGLRIEETTKRVKEVESKLREWIPKEDLSMIIANVGVYNGFPAAFTTNAGTQDAFMIVELTEDRKKTSQEYAKIIRQKLPPLFPDMEMGIQLGGLLSSAISSGLKAPINIQVSGPESAKSYEIAKAMLGGLKALPGAVDVRIQERFDAPQINIDINREKSDKIGIYTDEIVKNVVSSLNGSITFKTSIWVNPTTGIDYFMGVRFPEDKIASLSSLQDIPLTGQNQMRSIPLKDVASVTLDNKAITELNRVNMQRVVNIYMDAQDRDIGSLASDVQRVIQGTKIPASYTANIQGDIAEMKKSVESLGGGFLLAAFLVYLVLVVQFRSFLYPGIMMLTVPLGMVGIILMFVLTNTYFSLQAAIGTIFMVGIAVSNGVLLIEFIQHKIGEGKLSLDEAILSGAMARLRPILMTSLASILGLMPMALALSKGSEANSPLGRAVIGGQLLSTILTLFVLPTIFRFVSLRINKKEIAE